MTAQCIRCTRPMADQAYACALCATWAGERLTLVAEVTPAARDVAQGLSRRSRGGGASGKPGSRLPLDLGATARLDAVQNELGGWARITAEERHGRPLAHAGEDPIVHAARYLLANLEWWRHRPQADEFLTDVDIAARVVAGIARGPVAQRYLGPCGAWLLIEGVDGPWSCDGDVYARDGGHTGTCRNCGATVDTAERRAWLDEQTRDRAYRASEIEDAHGVKAHNIRNWADKGRIRVHGHDRIGRNLYLLSEVLDHARDLARRKAEGEAKRAARAPA